MSCCPKSNTDNSNNAESKEYKTISYERVSDDLNSVVNGIKLSIDIKSEIWNSFHKKPKEDNIKGINTMVDVLSKVPPEMMRQAQEEDLETSKVMCYVKSGKSHLWLKLGK